MSKIHKDWQPGFGESRHSLSGHYGWVMEEHEMECGRCDEEKTVLVPRKMGGYDGGTPRWVRCPNCRKITQAFPETL